VISAERPDARGYIVHFVQAARYGVERGEFGFARRRRGMARLAIACGTWVNGVLLTALS
jgi:hypothetical protein